MKVQFAQKNGVGLLQAHDDFCVLGRNTLLEDTARSGGSDAGCINVVLQGNRNPMQWSASFPAPLLGFHFTRRCKRLLPRHCNEGINRLVVLVDSIETRLCKIDG